ncbi:KilA-N domain-containing protein [Moraxella osloensis]|uniref:KilA-N domain-containing protein n=1 Tax=Faucicola osloensis TaxID=34062 RepID=UPI0020035CAA|nr:KilA-N domain-containing protein [Moraxella osloensis]MCK6157194.1 KilA-N domain-containing protein [Moraxella osloensis]
MNAIAVTNQTFTIAETVINMVDGLYSLNDLHKASGGEPKHKPSNFIRNDETNALINEILLQNSDAQNRESAIASVIRVIKGNFGDIKQGTYVCKEIVYRYAMWISPKFALIVIRAFDAMVTRTDSTQRAVLVAACTKLSAGNMAISDVYKMVGGKFGYDNIIDIPTPLLPEAIAYVYETMMVKNKPVSRNNGLIDEKTADIVMNYVFDLQKEVQRLGGVLPPSPVVHEKIIVEGIVTRMLENSKIMLNFDINQGVRARLIPNQHWIVDSDSIVDIVGKNDGVSKEKLPAIVNAIMARLS